MHELSDEELVERFQRGDGPEAAMHALFDRYGAMTYAFFRRRIGNPEIAAEQNQDLFVAVLDNLNGFRGEASFKTWLFRLAHNRLHHLRRRWRVHVDERTAETPDALWDVLRSGDEPLDARAERGERARAVRRCLILLNETERAVVLGQYWEGTTLDELTRRLRMTNRSGARASLLSAQRRLRRCLERHGIFASDGGAA